MQNYSIASGDCLYSIVSSKYGDKIKSEDDMWKAIDSIAELNNTSDPNLIYAGDTIKLPDYDSIFSQKTSNEGQTASSEDANEACKWIRDELHTLYGDVANEVIIQYGGSVKASNSKELFEMSDIDGGLVGGASLNAEEFANIINY